MSITSSLLLLLLSMIIDYFDFKCNISYVKKRHLINPSSKLASIYRLGVTIRASIAMIKRYIKFGQ